jgi:beta-glucanase (GH16 family)
MLELLPSRRIFSALPLQADFDGNGQVDAQDFTILAQHFGQPGTVSTGDANNDGQVNAQDFNLVAGEFGDAGFGKRIFSDEFVGTSLSSVWTPSQYWWPDDHTLIGRDELEAYDASGVSVSDGALHLTARPESKYGASYVSGLVQTGGKQDHPTSPRFSFKFGYIEIRAKLPAGQGIFPAMWMMPASFDDSAGELDLMENIGSDASTVYFTTHHDAARQGHHFTGPDFSAGYHTFGVDWQPDHITWYVDGVPHGTCTDPNLICSEAMYPILNVAVGGSWPGAPDATTRFPASMDVDYVRVYQS